MVVTKTFELRDRNTFIPVLASLTDDSYLLRRAGFSDKAFILLINLNTLETQHDCFLWGNRTLKEAHRYLLDGNNFHTIADGSVLDIEFILGETPSPKESERNS